MFTRSVQRRCVLVSARNASNFIASSVRSAQTTELFRQGLIKFCAEFYCSVIDSYIYSLNRITFSILQV